MGESSIMDIVGQVKKTWQDQRCRHCGVRCGDALAADRSKLAQEVDSLTEQKVQAVKDRDMEWWEALACVDNVAPTPEAVKEWVMIENEYHLQEATKDLVAQRDALQRFKDWVHARLDSLGVPKEFPDGPHTKEGCRVGDRLDWLYGGLRRYASQYDAAVSKITALQRSLDEIRNSPEPSQPCSWCNGTGKAYSDDIGPISGDLQSLAIPSLIADREQLGRVVRDAWVERQALLLTACQESVCLSWEFLPDFDQETYRCIADAVLRVAKGEQP